ncbi:MAG: hypothetical protein JOZ33_06995 [Acidobacteriaceae bacterium]|nr:hypothetical protein [Acidobacteriaceae bacterium]
MPVVFGVLASAQNQPPEPWVLQSSGTKASLRGIHAVAGGVAWASGTNGTVLRTEDGGYMWQSCAMPPGAENLDFRGIWAWDANTAIVMSSGPGDLSRLYKTTDGCSSWKLVFTNPDKDGFWDAMVFSEDKHGSLLGDPVNGEFAFFETFDQGDHWTRDSSRGLRSGLKEGVFAASNSSLSEKALGTEWLFGTGGAAGGRVFQSINGSSADGLFRDWMSITVPLGRKSISAGIFSIAFRDDAKHGVAVGGDYKKPNESAGTAAWSADGGKTWTAAQKSPHGYRSAVAWDADAKAWIAVGTNGSDVSYDDGKTWSPLDNGNWNALSLPWVVGPEGRIAKIWPVPKRK